jgi:hypothetical protein
MRQQFIASWIGKGEEDFVRKILFSGVYPPERSGISTRQEFTSTLLHPENIFYIIPGELSSLIVTDERIVYFHAQNPIVIMLFK